MKKFVMVLLGIIVVMLIADRLGFGPNRPRFPVGEWEEEPYSVLTREQSNFIADIRIIGLSKDKRQVGKVLAALTEDHPLIIISALLALGRLGAVEAIDEVHLLQTRVQENSELQLFTTLALARIEAERSFPQVDNKDQLRMKIRKFLQAAGVSPSQIRKASSWYAELLRAKLYPRWAPFEVQVLRHIAEMTGEAYQRGIKEAFSATGMDFSVDYVARLKAGLAQMNRQQRVQWLVDSLSKKQFGRREENYEMQALADEGDIAKEAIIVKLKEMQRDRASYPYHIGFALLFDVLVTIGDREALPIIRSFLNDRNKWVRYYSERAHGFLSEGRRVVWAVDY